MRHLTQFDAGLAAFAARTYARNIDWLEDQSLWTSAATARSAVRDLGCPAEWFR